MITVFPEPTTSSTSLRWGWFVYIHDPRFGSYTRDHPTAWFSSLTDAQIFCTDRMKYFPELKADIRSAFVPCHSSICPVGGSCYQRNDCGARP